MALLILRDRHGVELIRQPMAPQERYHVYACCQEGIPLTVGPSQYRVLTAAWRVPAEELVLSVTWLRWATPEACDS